MSVFERNNVQVSGQGDRTLVFAHGLGCNQHMWRYITPAFADKYKIALFDLVGCGKSDLSAYDYSKYSSLEGYATDLLEILAGLGDGSVIYVGHSVSAMIGLLASVRAHERFTALIMFGPSPRFINDGSYTGGFTRADIEELCDTIDSNYFGWSSSVAPTLMGAPERPELAKELADSFCHTDPQIAKHFSRVAFMADNRKFLPQCSTPTLILQCSDDFIAPRSVGDYMQKEMPHAELEVIENLGHYPHLSAPEASIRAIKAYLRKHDF